MNIANNTRAESSSGIRDAVLHVAVLRVHGTVGLTPLLGKVFTSCSLNENTLGVIFLYYISEKPDHRTRFIRFYSVISTLYIFYVYKTYQTAFIIVDFKS